MRLRKKTITAPGWPRRLTRLAVIFLTASLSLLLLFIRPLGDLELAGVIFVLSFIGHSILAWLTFDSVKAWRAVDYPWVCASFIAVIFALANGTETALKQELQAAKLSYQDSLAILRNTAQILVDYYCKDFSPSALQKQVCERLPLVIESTDYSLVGVNKPDFAIGGTPDWWDLVLPPDYQRPDPMPSLGAGSWDGVKGAVEQANSTKQSYMLALQGAYYRERSWQALFVSTGVRYWYFLVAFFVGLRLSRTTAELLQANARRVV
jgi:hypothetical protein